MLLVQLPAAPLPGRRQHCAFRNPSCSGRLLPSFWPMSPLVRVFYIEALGGLPAYPEGHEGGERLCRGRFLDMIWNNPDFQA